MDPRALLLISAVLMAACNGAALNESADGGALDAASIVTGIYHLSIKTNSDDCDPPRLSGDLGDGPVLALPNDIKIWTETPNSDGLAPEYDLPELPATGASLQSGPLGYCDGGSSLVDELQLLAAPDGQVRVSHLETWTGGPCSLPPGQLSNGDVPTGSCHSDQTLTYTLVTPCPPPHTLVSNGTGVSYSCQ